MRSSASATDVPAARSGAPNRTHDHRARPRDHRAVADLGGAVADQSRTGNSTRGHHTGPLAHVAGPRAQPVSCTVPVALSDGDRAAAPTA